MLDSSRNFVLMIEDGHGKHAFIGLGFNERNEVFDFNVALSDHEKYVKRKRGEARSGGGEGAEEGHLDIHLAVDHRLKVSLLCGILLTEAYCCMFIIMNSILLFSCKMENLISYVFKEILCIDILLLSY